MKCSFVVFKYSLPLTKASVSNAFILTFAKASVSNAFTHLLIHPFTHSFIEK